MFWGKMLSARSVTLHKRRGLDKRGRLPIFVLVLFVDRGHERGCWWEDLVDKDEDGLVGGQLDALADDVDELADC